MARTVAPVSLGYGNGVADVVAVAVGEQNVGQPRRCGLALLVPKGGIAGENGSIRILAFAVSMWKANVQPFDVHDVLLRSRAAPRTSRAIKSFDLCLGQAYGSDQRTGKIESVIPWQFSRWRNSRSGCRLSVGGRPGSRDENDRPFGFRSGAALCDAARCDRPRQVRRRRAGAPGLAEKEGIAGLHHRLAVNMDGSEGPRCQATRAFVRNMGEKTDIPFVLWDERLSTVAAERVLIEMDVSRKKRAERIDSAAASFILQGALDRLASLARGASGDRDAP